MFLKKIMKITYLIILLVALMPLTMAVEYSEKDIYDAKQNAYALYSTGQSEKALDILTKIPQDYRDEETYLIFANIYEDMSNESRSINYLNKALRVNSNNYKTYYNLGCIFAKKKNYPLAIENFKKSVNIKVDFADGYYNLAWVYFEMGNYKQAKKYYIRTLSHNSGYKDAMYNLALTYKKLNKQEEAEKLLEKIKE